MERAEERGSGFEEAKGTVEELVSNLPSFSKEETDTFGKLADMVSKFSTLSSPPLPPSLGPAAALGRDWLVALLARLSQNGFTVADSECQPLGLALFPLASTVNHSCLPTVASSFARKQGEPPALRMRAVRSAEKGEEVTNAYIDVGMPTAGRRRELKKSYCFECDCERCGDTARDAWVEEPERREITAGTTAELGEASSAELWNVWKESPGRSHRRLASGNELAARLIDSRDFGRAATVLKGTLEATEYCLFENSPVLAVGLYKLVKLLEYEERDLDLAADLRRKAGDALKVCYGEEDDLYREVAERW